MKIYNFAKSTTQKISTKLFLGSKLCLPWANSIKSLQFRRNEKRSQRVKISANFISRRRRRFLFPLIYTSISEWRTGSAKMFVFHITRERGSVCTEVKYLPVSGCQKGMNDVAVQIPFRTHPRRSDEKSFQSNAHFCSDGTTWATWTHIRAQNIQIIVVVSSPQAG